MGSVEQTYLFILSGLPATGKSTLSKFLCQHFDATYIRIDTVEQALRDLCNVVVTGEGYRLSYRIAQDNLKLGTNVVADSCNPIELTRKEWVEIANSVNCKFINIEIICSDANEHRERASSRKKDISTLKLPTWDEILYREYHPWTRNRIILDTAGKSIEKSVEDLVHSIDEYMTIENYHDNKT